MHIVASPESLTPEGLTVIRLTRNNQGTFDIASPIEAGGKAIYGGRDFLHDWDDSDFAVRCRESISSVVGSPRSVAIVSGVPNRCGKSKSLTAVADITSFISAVPKPQPCTEFS